MVMTVVGVSTELGWMEQVRERGEPYTNSDSVPDTITTGMGTEGERYTLTQYRSYAIYIYSLLTVIFLLSLTVTVILRDGILVIAWQVYILSSM